MNRTPTGRYFHENLMNLLELLGRVGCLVTPWHTDHLNRRLHQNSASGLFRRPVGDFAPVWPEHWSRKRIAERRETGEVAFARADRLHSCFSLNRTDSNFRKEEENAAFMLGKPTFHHPTILGFHVRHLRRLR